jgi:hypothetical protein
MEKEETLPSSLYDAILHSFQNQTRRQPKKKKKEKRKPELQTNLFDEH